MRLDALDCGAVTGHDRRQAAGCDHAGIIPQDGAEPADELFGLSHRTEDQSGLERADRVAPDRRLGCDQRDLRQLRGLAGERIEADLQPGRDRNTDVRAVAIDGAERGRRPEIDDDRGRPDERDGADRGRDQVAADLARTIGADHHRLLFGGAEERRAHAEVFLAAFGERTVDDRHDGRYDDRRDVFDRKARCREERREEDAVLVGGASPRRRHAPRSGERAGAVEGAELRLGVADIDAQEVHAR